MPKTSKNRQRVYKMKGCSKKNKKFFLGGSDNLAYPSSSVPTIPPPLAYTGKGGATNLTNAFPNLGPPAREQNWIGSQATSGGGSKGGSFGCGIPVMSGGTCMSCLSPLMTGGCCGQSQPSAMTGGSCGPSCALGYQVAGKKKLQKRAMRGGNPGIPYPNGLVGKSWTPAISGWPGVDGVDSGRNYLANNLYKNDPQTMMKLDGGSRKNKSRKVRGGGLMPQEFVNLGRDLSFNLKSSFNSLNGYSAPVNPKPYMDQFPNPLSINKMF